MKGSDIVKHIATELPKYTNLFTTQIAINSLTSVGNIATFVLSEARNLIVGSQVFITGAKPYIDITSITREGNIVTITTSQAHTLPYIDNRATSAIRNQYTNTITIENAEPIEYNGTWAVYTSLNDTTITFKITTTPITPATTNGRVLFKDFDNYNGYKTITEVVNSTTYKYELQQASNLPVVGNIYYNLTRVGNALSITNIINAYNQNNTRNLEKYIYTVLSGGDLYKSDFIPTSDPSATHQSGRQYDYFYRKTVNIYIMLPYNLNTQGVEQGELADELHNVILPAIQKILANFSVPSPYSQCSYEGFTLQSDDLIEEIQNGTYAIYNLTMASEVRLKSEDVYNFEGGVPFKNVDVFFNNGIESKVAF